MSEPSSTPTRRALIGAGASVMTLTILRPAIAAQEQTLSDMAAAIREFVGGASITPGKVALDIPPLVENGNSVPVTVKVESPMTPDNHVTAIAIFNEKNPQPNVANFHLGPRAGRAEVSTRIRLATTQTITAIAKMKDGSCWSATAEVLVTIAACTEE